MREGKVEKTKLLFVESKRVDIWDEHASKKFKIAQASNTGQFQVHRGEGREGGLGDLF